MAAQEWARTAGLSLRPWSGHSPTSLIIRGAIHVAVSGVVLYFAFRMRSEDEFATATEAEFDFIRSFSTLIIIACIVTIIVAAVRIAIGIFDLVSAKTVEGMVVDVGRRRLGDILPGFAQEMIFSRRSHGYDTRRYRTEVVIETRDGVKSWTVRNSRAEQLLQPGAHVRMKVTPIAGSVSQVQQI